MWTVCWDLPELWWYSRNFSQSLAHGGSRAPSGSPAVGVSGQQRRAEGPSWAEPSRASRSGLEGRRGTVMDGRAGPAHPVFLPAGAMAASSDRGLSPGNQQRLLRPAPTPCRPVVWEPGGGDEAPRGWRGEGMVPAGPSGRGQWGRVTGTGEGTGGHVRAVGWTSLRKLVYTRTLSLPCLHRGHCPSSHPSQTSLYTEALTWDWPVSSLLGPTRGAQGRGKAAGASALTREELEGRAPACPCPHPAALAGTGCPGAVT